jgi:endonuclease YncB( thermonuclease family)
MADRYVVIQGEYVIVGKQPDGDSVRFKADNPSLFAHLPDGGRVEISRGDGTTQLRFQGIDAPELHYNGEIQPLSRQARNVLLNRMGFGRITYNRGLTVQETENRVRGVVLAKEAETHGRPISYLLLASNGAGMADGDQVEAGEALLQKTLNYMMLVEGMAYYLGYDSMPEAHRDLFREASRSARNVGLGVWQQDATDNFDLEDESSIGPDGQLIFPKLFRRCTDYMHAEDHDNFPGNFLDWLKSTDQRGPNRTENDPVLVKGQRREFADLIQEKGNRISLDEDLLDLLFVEKN